MKKFFRKKRKASEELPFKRTFKDGLSYRKWHEVLEENSAQVERMLRGNYGGGCPSPFNEEL